MLCVTTWDAHAVTALLCTHGLLASKPADQNMHHCNNIAIWHEDVARCLNMRWRSWRLPSASHMLLTPLPSTPLTSRHIDQFEEVFVGFWLRKPCSAGIEKEPRGIPVTVLHS